MIGLNEKAKKTKVLEENTEDVCFCIGKTFLEQKAYNHREKTHKVTLSKLRMSALWKISLRKWKGNAYLGEIFLISDIVLTPTHTQKYICIYKLTI